MTIMYISIQETLHDQYGMAMVRDTLCKYYHVENLIGYLAKSYSETRTSFDGVHAQCFR